MIFFACTELVEVSHNEFNVYYYYSTINKIQQKSPLTQLKL